MNKLFKNKKSGYILPLVATIAAVISVFILGYVGAISSGLADSLVPNATRNNANLSCTAWDHIYNGKSQQLITRAAEINSNATIYYAVLDSETQKEVEAGTKQLNDVLVYSTDLPFAKDVDTYYIYISARGDLETEDIIPGTYFCTSNIYPRPLNVEILDPSDIEPSSLPSTSIEPTYPSDYEAGTITGANEVWEYDGKYHYAVFRLTNVAEGENPSYTIENNSIIDAGSKVVTITINDNNYCFESPIATDKRQTEITIIVTPRPIMITTTERFRTYGDSAVYSDEKMTTEKTFDYTLVYNGTKENVTEVVVTNEETGTLDDLGDIVMEIQGPYYVYNADNTTILNYETASSKDDVIASGEPSSITITNTQRAGEYMIAFNADKSYYNPNYVYAYNASMFHIYKKELSDANSNALEINSVEMTYGDTPWKTNSKFYSFSTNGLVNDDYNELLKGNASTLSNLESLFTVTNNSTSYSCQGTSANWADAGTYTISIKADDIASYNYVFKDIKTGTLVINKANMSVSYSGYSGTYDSGYHRGSVSATTVNSLSYTVYYSTNGGSSWSTSSPGRSDAGTTNVYFRVTADNHNDSTGSYSISISRKSVTISANSASKNYDGYALTAGYSVYGLVGGDSIGASTGGSQTEPGSSTSYISNYWFNSGNSDNYDISTSSGTLTVYGVGSGSQVGKYIDCYNNSVVNGIIFRDSCSTSSSYPKFYYGSARCYSNSTWHSSVVKITSYSYAHASYFYDRFTFAEIESCTSSSNYTTAYIKATSSTSVSYSLYDDIGDNQGGDIPSISLLRTIYNTLGISRFGTRKFPSSQASSWSILGINFSTGKQCTISNGDSYAILVNYR